MTQVWVEKNRVCLRAEFRDRDVCKAIPGYRWNPERKFWHYPATAEVAARILEAFGPNSLQVTEEFASLAGRARKADEARKFRDATDLPDLPRPPESPEAWLHQRQAFHMAKEMDAFMLAVGMGGGKSKVGIGLLEEWKAKQVLIICPTNVLKVWPKEFAGAPEESKPGHQVRRWSVLNGMRRDRKGKLVTRSISDRVTEFTAALDAATDEYPVVVCINYEATAREDFAVWARSRKWDVVLLDESHRIKSPGGVQSKFCDSLRPHAHKRLCLTGTPMPHSPLDVYAQYRFLDPGVYGTSYARFRQRYAVMGGFQGRQVLGINEATAPELSERMASLAYIISNEDLDDVLGLQPPVWPPMKLVALSSKSQKAYDGLLNDFVAGVDEGTVTVNNALTQLLRLQQVTSGYLPVEQTCDACGGDGCGACDGSGVRTKVVELGSEKRDALGDWMADIQPPVWEGEPFQSTLTQPGEPICVAVRFIHDLDSVKAVAHKQGRRYMELSGRDSAGLTENALMHRDCDVLGVQIQAGGVGIDLTRAHYVANFSVGFSLGDFDQWLKRTHRPGQSHRVVYQNFAAEGTVDAAVFSALREKKEVVNYIMALARGGTL